MKSELCHLSEALAVDRLKCCLLKMPKGSKLILIESFFSEEIKQSFCDSLENLWSLFSSVGYFRTDLDYAEILDKAGFEIHAYYALSHGYKVIEASPAF